MIDGSRQRDKVAGQQPEVSDKAPSHCPGRAFQTGCATPDRSGTKSGPALGCTELRQNEETPENTGENAAFPMLFGVSEIAETGLEPVTQRL